MFRRTLQKIKGGSFVLTIPKEWVREMKLSQGQQLTLFRQQGALLVYPTTTRQRDSFVTVKLEDYEDLKSLRHSVVTYYMQGSTRIDVVSKGTIPFHRKQGLKLIRDELIGFEVDAEEPNRCSFLVMVDPGLGPVQSLLQKTSSYAIDMQRTSVESFVKCDEKLAVEVLEKKKDAMRQYRVTIRQITLASRSASIAQKVGVRDCQECITFALAARDLNRIVYHSAAIAKRVVDGQTRSILGKASKAILEKIRSMSQITCIMQEKAVRAFIEKDHKIALEVIAEMESPKNIERQILRHASTEREINLGIALGLTARDIRRIAGFCVAIADDAMNRSLTPPVIQR